MVMAWVLFRGEGIMMLIKLPWKDRKVISEVAKLYCDMAINGEGFDDRIRQFWRISMYVKVGLLFDEDARTICTAMETFREMYQENPSYKDPNGIFRNMDVVIPKLKALIEQKSRKSEKLA